MFDDEWVGGEWSSSGEFVGVCVVECFEGFEWVESFGDADAPCGCCASADAGVAVDEEVFLFCSPEYHFFDLVEFGSVVVVGGVVEGPDAMVGVVPLDFGWFWAGCDDCLEYGVDVF